MFFIRTARAFLSTSVKSSFISSLRVCGGRRGGYQSSSSHSFESFKQTKKTRKPQQSIYVLDLFIIRIIEDLPKKEYSVLIIYYVLSCLMYLCRHLFSKNSRGLLVFQQWLDLKWLFNLEGFIALLAKISKHKTNCLLDFFCAVFYSEMTLFCVYHYCSS